MNRIIYATGNEAKLSAMKSRLQSLGIEIIGLKAPEIAILLNGRELPVPEENGTTPLENARNKALTYYQILHVPVFSCDSGLYFDNVPDDLQPGVHVRTIQGKILTDEEMRVYYMNLAKQYGPLTARYRNAICFVKDDGHRYEAMDKTMESKPFILTAVPHSEIRRKGFPLDSISIDPVTGKYYYDLPQEALDQLAVEDGFLKFFKKIFV